MNALADIAASYLELRRALGFKLVRDGRVLGTFVAYLDERGLQTVTAEAALAWACQPADAGPGHWSKRLSVARGFAGYLRSIDPATELVPGRQWPQPRRQEPLVCSPDEITALVDAAGSFGSPFAACTYQSVIGILAVSGMRVGEALRLAHADVDLDGGLLTVRDTKFNKSREVALHPSTASTLGAYSRWRDERLGHRVGPSFFTSATGARLRYNRLWQHWQGAINRAGITRNGRRPRLHDLRHSFAVNTLRAWHDAGLDVEVRLPLLSTFLGHANPASTYWYLTATPDLLGAAARRLEASNGARL